MEGDGRDKKGDIPLKNIRKGEKWKEVHCTSSYVTHTAGSLINEQESSHIHTHTHTQIRSSGATIEVLS